MNKSKNYTRLDLSDEDGKFSKLWDRRYVNEPFRLE